MTASQRARRRQLRLLAEGRCMTCGRPNDSGFQHCDPCRGRRNRYTQDYLATYGRKPKLAKDK